MDIHRGIGQRYLRQFDKLDLENKCERRISVYALEEFYGIVMYKVGVENLNLNPEIKAKNLNTQWGRIVRRLESLAEFEDSEGYKSTISKLKAFRDNIAHNYVHDPSKKHIKQIREQAPDWRDWLIEWSEKYDEIHRELDARDTLIKLTDESINFVEDVKIPDREPFSEDVKSAIEDAKELRLKLDQTRENTSEISPELVRIFSDAKNLENFVDTSLEGAASIDVHFENEVDRVMEEKAFRRWKDQN